MLKILLKKQLNSYFTGAVRRSAFGKRKGGILIYAALVVYLIVIFGGMFGMLMDSLCLPLHNMGMDWLYFLYGGILATVLGVFGSVFMAQAQLFDAKDNELLLSLPFPPSVILFCRMVPIYLQNLLFEALALAPCYAIYGMQISLTPANVLCWVVLLLFTPIISLCISCGLGWVVELITSRMHNKSVFSIVLSLVFLAVYYWVYFKASQYISSLLLYSAAIGAAIQGAAYPLYLLGTAGCASPAGIVFAVVLYGVMLAILCWILSANYLDILTTKRGAARIHYKRKNMHSHSTHAALLRKEWKRFFGSATYTLNAGLGSVFLAVGAVASIIMRDTLLLMVEQFYPELVGHLPLVAVAAIVMICALNTVSASSISLEGKNLWLTQALPIAPWQTLHAKLKLHFWVSAPFAMVCSIALAWVLHPDLLTGILMVMIPLIAIAFFGCFGLWINLLHPKLDWDNEASAVKQSLSVTLALFGGMGTIFTLAALYFAVGRMLTPSEFMLLCGVVLAGFTGMLVLWLRKKGSVLFTNL